MAQEFVARKGLIAKDDSVISGSLNITQDLTIRLEKLENI